MSQYTVRLYQENDTQLVDAWAQAHGRDRLPVELLPPDGVIVEKDGEDIAAGWLYKSYGVGVAFLEHVHTRPGLSVSEAQEAINELVEYLRFSAREDNYGVIISHTVPAMARKATRSGWEQINNGLSQILTTTGLERKEAA